MSARIIKTIEFAAKDGSMLALATTSSDKHAMTFEVFNSKRKGVVAGSLDEQELIDLRSFIEEWMSEIDVDGV